MSDTPSPPPGLFILGMHRSGTSCLAGMLECAGFNAGQVDEWNPDNRKGNREHLAVTPLNEAVLRVNGGAWDRPPERVEVDDQQRREMDRIIVDLEDQGRPWFIKDPRILLVPRPWLDLRSDLRTIGIFRHPLAVAQSLARRDGLALDDGVSLWCRYNEALLALLDVDPFPLLLFTPDAGEFTRLVKAALAGSFTDEIQAGVIAPDDVGRFFSADLVHHVPPLRGDIGPELEAAGLAPDTVRAAARTWQELLARQSPAELVLGQGTDEHAGERVGKGIDEGTKEAQETVGVTASDTDADLDETIEATEDPTYLFRRRISELEAQERFDDLQHWLEGWLERRPDDPYLSWELARVEWTLGRQGAALARAGATCRLAPGWIVPLERMAEWAMEAGEWQTAADAYQRLRRAERALVKTPELAMQVYFDQGEGFNEAASIKVPLGRRTGHFDTTIEAGPLGADVRQLRLDPINQPAVIAGVSLRVINGEDESFELAPTDDNATFHDGRAWHFDDDDPKLVYLDERIPKHPLRSLQVAFDVEHVGEDARLAGFQAMQALVGRWEALEQCRAHCARLEDRVAALEQRREVLESALAVMTSRHGAATADLHALRERHAAILSDIRDLDGRLVEIRESLAAQLGERLARAIMTPATLGRGQTSLDELAEQWRALDAIARDTPDEAAD